MYSRWSFGQAAQDVGGCVRVAAVVGRAVLGLGDRDVGHAVKQAFDADPALGAGQRRARAGWTPWPNAMCSRAFAAVDVELVGVLEAARGRGWPPVEHHDRGAGGDVDATDRRRHACQPEVALHRALEAQRLLDEVRDAAAVVAQELLQLGAFADQLERGAEEADGGLLPGGEEEGGDPDDIDDLGRRAVRERRVARPVITSSRGSRRRSST